MRILLLGSKGFVGRHLVSRFQLAKIQYFTLSHDICNLLDLQSVERLFENLEDITHIFHCAVYTKAGNFGKYHSAEIFHNNQLMNTNILYAWNKYHPQAKMLTFGTSAAYNPNIEKIENNYLESTPESDYEEYAMTKRMLLTGLQAYNKQYGLNYIYYIPTTIYGPNYDLTDKHFIFNLVRKICNAKYLNIRPVVLFGKGTETRNLIHIDDVINMIFNTFELNNKLINLSSKSSITIQAYARHICNNVQIDYDEIIWDIQSGFGKPTRNLVLNPIFKDYKFKEWTDGVNEIIEYYKNNGMKLQTK